jgi:hypothetical protein
VRYDWAFWKSKLYVSILNLDCHLKSIGFPRFSASFCKYNNKPGYGIFVGKPEGKRPMGRPRRRWVDNIKMDLREIRWDGLNGIDLAQDND